MQSDSATESDDESSIGVNDVERNSTHFSFQIMERDVQDERLLHEATLEALEKITLFDLPAVQRDSSLHQDILSASDDILYFLDRGCARVVDDVNAVDDLFLLHRLVNVKFLSILFRHRKTSRVIAAKATTPNAATTIVCWVDVVLAKLSMFILHVAGGFSRHPLAPCSEFIQYQREEDCVKAATQMPEKWESVIDVIGSNKTSPAAIRLATRLVFAAYVMAPQLNGDEEQDLNTKDIILEALTLVSPTILGSTFQVLRLDSHLQIDAKVNESIAKCNRQFTMIRENPGSSTLTQYLLTVKSTLSFLALMWHYEIESCIAPRPVSLLLSTTMTIVQSLKHSYHLPGVRDALLTAVSVSGGACEIDEEMFSVLAIQSECSNFIAASAYSHRIMATEENHDPLLLAETWNYLRDVLLLIISRRCAEDDEALALLVSPIICTAMTKIAQTTSPAELSSISAKEQQLIYLMLISKGIEIRLEMGMWLPEPEIDDKQVPGKQPSDWGMSSDIPPFVLGDRHAAAASPNPSFATKSSDFHFFPRREGDSKKRPRRSNQPSESRSMDLDDVEHSDLTSLSHLRSSAFWELHRSITENGEGFVRRMRDYEHSRSRSDIYLKAKEAQKRGRKQSSVAASAASRKFKFLRHESGDQENDDDDDVQIFAGELPRISLPGSPCFKSRSMSLDLMDEDTRDYDLTTFANERCSSPGATCDSNSSIYHSDDEHLESSGTTSPLSQSLFSSSPPHPYATSFASDTHTDCMSSSAVSLPLPPLSPPESLSSLRVITPSTSRSEKAIAALSLAMANGAGGISDYEALLAMQNPPALDGCEIGELWH
ncbi:hypothetical protein D9615_005280 [Tricholomella constricta]|uniref:Uncharacterized protein n=1 Tax=Tricholomella constricta TaxID=117010 RepID=A0A8H5H6C0_9AGAR|nr:hypothetical protein D9615_005280 [Tricholomella constricta]